MSDEIQTLIEQRDAALQATAKAEGLVAGALRDRDAAVAQFDGLTAELETRTAELAVERDKLDQELVLRSDLERQLEQANQAGAAHLVSLDAHAARLADNEAALQAALDKIGDHYDLTAIGAACAKAGIPDSLFESLAIALEHP